MEIYAPIAHRLGMQRIKWELEDLSLQYLDPIGYQEIADQLSARSAAHEEFMANAAEKDPGAAGSGGDPVHPFAAR